MTEKQRAFCRYVVEGNTAVNAYKMAYNTQAGERTIAVEASKMMKRPDIQEELNRLRQPLEADLHALALSEREKQIAFVRERIQACLEKEDEANCRMYTDMLNKILGLYKEETNVDPGQNALKEMDTESLMKLIS